MPDFYAEPYLHLAGLTHKSALITWGAFYFKIKESSHESKLVDDSDLKHVYPPRRQSIGSTSEPYGEAAVRVSDMAGNLCASATTSATNHVWVTGLSPDTEYRYEVHVKGKPWADGGRRDWVAERKALELRGRSYDNVFRTLPDPSVEASGPLSFAVIGDFGVGVRKPGSMQREVADALEAVGNLRRIRFVVTTGDNIYAQRKILGVPVGGTGDEDDDWFFTFYQPYRYLINRMPVFPSIGNHDSDETEGRDDRSQLFDNFYLAERMAAEVPAGRASEGPGLFYRLRVGSRIELIAIDTSREPDVYPKRLFLHPHNKQFLEQAFPQADDPRVWRIPFGHHPPFCAGPFHGNTREFAAAEFNLLELFERANVRVVLSGHEHNFQCSRRNGVFFVLTGGAAKVRGGRPSANAMAEAHTECWSAECHCLIVTIDGERMTIEPVTRVRQGVPVYLSASAPNGDAYPFPVQLSLV